MALAATAAAACAHRLTAMPARFGFGLPSMRALWTAPALRRADAVVSAEAEESSVLGSVAPVEEAGKAAPVDRSKLVQYERVNNIPHSGRKLNMLLAPLRNIPVQAAVLQLRFSQKRHARAIREALERGAHQAVQRFQMDPTKLYIEPEWTRCHAAEAIVNKGQFLKRVEFKGRSRTGIRHHPRNHVILAIKEREKPANGKAERLAVLARREPRERKVYSIAG